jgi:hypothetical protein
MAMFRSGARLAFSERIVVSIIDVVEVLSTSETFRHGESISTLFVVGHSNLHECHVQFASSMLGCMIADVWKATLLRS